MIKTIITIAIIVAYRGRINKTKQKTKNRVVGGGGEVNRTKQLNRAFITKKAYNKTEKVK